MTTVVTPTQNFMNQRPAQILQTLITQQETGKLTIYSSLDEFVSWQVYLGNGRIHFANSGVGVMERLNYLLGDYLHKGQIKLPKQLTDDYRYLCDLWKEGIFFFSTNSLDSDPIYPRSLSTNFIATESNLFF